MFRGLGIPTKPRRYFNRAVGRLFKLFAAAQAELLFGTPNFSQVVFGLKSDPLMPQGAETLTVPMPFGTSS